MNTATTTTTTTTKRDNNNEISNLIKLPKIWKIYCNQ